MITTESPAIGVTFAAGGVVDAALPCPVYPSVPHPARVVFHSNRFADIVAAAEGVMVTLVTEAGLRQYQISQREFAPA
jgi:hypothetical protein